MTTHTKHRNTNKNDFDLHGDIAKIKAALANTAHHMKNRTKGALSNTVENAKDTSLQWKDNVEEYVTDKPLKSLGLAMLSGIFLGYLIHGKRKSRHR